jgi:hypothetical protein
MVILVAACGIGWYAHSRTPPAPEHAVRIGYFHGGRTGIAFRTYVNGYFEREQVHVEYFTSNLRGDRRLYRLPQSSAESQRLRGLLKGSKAFGKVDGETLIDDVLENRVDGACVGEASFLLAVDRGAPIVAVCSLGHDRKGEPGHAIVFRRSVVVHSGADLKGKTLISRRAGPGDETLLREFVRAEGLDPDRDVKIISDVDDDRYIDMIRRGDCAGGYYHLLGLKPLVVEGTAYVYRPLDWVPSTIVQSLLVFRRDYYESHRSQVERIVRALVKRVHDEKTRPGDRTAGDKGDRIDMQFLGMNLPDVDDPPVIRKDMLLLMQQLLVKNRFLKKQVNVDPFIDNQMVEDAVGKAPPR